MKILVKCGTCLEEMPLSTINLVNGEFMFKCDNVECSEFEKTMAYVVIDLGGK